jgi:hypothetical protein
MDIKPNLFDLSAEDIATSQMLYEGKIIKCLVAPYHSFAQLEPVIPFTKNTFLFPEREMQAAQLPHLISMIVKNPSTEEFRIITTNQNIILDMVDSSVRVLTEKGEVLPSPCKTFMANIHDIRYSLLENPDHRLSEREKTAAHERVNKLIERADKSYELSIDEFDQLIKEIEMIGEPVITNVLKNQACEHRHR